MLSKNTCERVYLIVKLLAMSLQACKFTKNELLYTHFSKILVTIIVHFLGIISWKGASRFNGRGVVFQRGDSFLYGGSMRSIGFDGFSKKKKS